MPLILLIAVVLVTVWLTNGLVLFPIQIVHWPNLPLWLSWTIVIALLSWLIGD